MHEITERSIPTHAPKSGERRGGGRGLHDRARGDAERPPQERKEMEKPEMKEDQNANHSNPASNVWMGGTRRQPTHPDHRRPENRLHRCESPLANIRRRNRSDSTKGSHIHPRPE